MDMITPCRGLSVEEINKTKIPLYPPNRGVCCINRVVLFYNPPISEKYGCFLLLIRKTSLPLQQIP